MSQEHDDFWALFQEVSDRRLDPFEDARIVEYLEQHPELLQETAAIRQTVFDLRSARPTSRRRPLLVAAAALIVFAFGTALITYPRLISEDSGMLTDPLAGESRIISFRMRLERGTALSRQIMVYDGSATWQHKTKIQEWRFTQRALSPRTDRLLSFHASRTIQ
ncbi:MAG: hypothetical protein ACYTG5_06135 [Planctomycetota bacterium]|jgi:hypothetical protein